ncbi:MAG: GDP-L-fucose synthase [Alphaproteobacteria bacterium]|nr:GDP-L-fucose synthase [Alphaproteobacteria bacterium]
MSDAPIIYTLEGKRVWVAGHRGLVGAAVVRRLNRERCTLLTVDRATLDLKRQAAVEAWLKDARPQAIILAAATVGGIASNDARPAEFLYDNLMIQANVIEAARQSDVEKVLVLGSTCIYPKFAPQPIAEEDLLTGPLEPTNEWYALAKIAGVKLAEAYRRQYGFDVISAMPTNLYGPGDFFAPEASHVIPALIGKIHAAKARGEASVEIWGTGRPKREFLHCDDAADALVFLMTRYSDYSTINVGTGEDLSIRELATLIAEIVDYSGGFHFNTQRPDGTPRKLTAGKKLAALGWKARTNLRDGLAATYQWYRAALADGRVRA